MFPRFLSTPCFTLHTFGVVLALFLARLLWRKRFAGEVILAYALIHAHNKAPNATAA